MRPFSMRPFIEPCLIVVLLLFSQAAIGKNYIVEMVFFANTGNPADSVHISNQTITPDLGGSIALEQGESSNGFVALGSNTFALAGKAAALNKSGEYKVLKHIAWLQPGLAREDAIAVRIHAGKNYKSEFDERSFSTQPVNELDGTVKIVLGRYLHLYTDLAYRKPFTLSSGDALGRSQVLADFAIKTHRKMRSKTLHYIDHPYLGILIEIRPAG